MKVRVLVAQSCLTLCDPMDYSLPDSSARGILQARILQWVAIPFSKGSYPLSLLHCGQIIYSLSHQEAQLSLNFILNWLFIWHGGINVCGFFFFFFLLWICQYYCLICWKEYSYLITKALLSKTNWPYMWRPFCTLYFIELYSYPYGSTKHFWWFWLL